MSDKKIDAIDQSQHSSDELTSREKLLSSIDQLTQVLDILGRLTERIQHQVEVMSDVSEQKTKDVVTTEKVDKEEVSIH
ncbi:MAG: hypothetical protein AAFZ92_07200 [Pseudomonadota bacterium]